LGGGSTTPRTTDGGKTKNPFHATDPKTWCGNTLGEKRGVRTPPVTNQPGPSPTFVGTAPPKHKEVSKAKIPWKSTAKCSPNLGNFFWDWTPPGVSGVFNPEHGGTSDTKKAQNLLNQRGFFFNQPTKKFLWCVNTLCGGKENQRRERNGLLFFLG